ncbi:MAG: nitroreductase family protein [Bacteroidales bacterium]|nr:nitroreductase family protein [Bacteroidales bacterium]MBR5072137.1 nitroreductase family protein [Bacteroidales bacterium]
MEFIDVIQKRHSVRKFTGEPVDRELIDAILDIAATAPSSRNSHSSAFMVVDDRDTLSAIAEMRDHGSAFVKGAAAAIVVMGDRSKTDIWVENAAISATFIQLAATAIDLGSCWVHVRDRLRSKDDPARGTAEEYLRSLLGIRDEYGVLCVVALGHEALPEE